MKNEKPILFVDFDGTICHDLCWHSLPEPYHSRIQTLLFKKDLSYVSGWLRGTYTAEEVNAYAAKLIDMPYEELWEIFVDDCSTMRVPESVLKRLSDLRKKYTVILMTGNFDSFSKYTVPALELTKYFDHISNSFYEGIHKTDNNGEIFLRYSERFGVLVSDCILIDDTEKVCSIFKNLGGKVFQILPEKDVLHYLDILEST